MYSTVYLGSPDYKTPDNIKNKALTVGTVNYVFCALSKSGWNSLMCLVRATFRTKHLPHSSHSSARSPSCSRMCLARLYFRANVFSQYEHRYGRSPVCDCMCVIRLYLLLNALSQCAHLNSRSPLCFCSTCDSNELKCL